ncbi:MAG: tripartite tricarboxylate transporter substrate binding protein [Betaproteobacteria bacterium]|jgi:tripartite-type tricarboxylate transporter receptor subunit TctC|nr:tripartite tricarboxylate transporter substrate binding protein [Betaproteobacteria bacterium]
MKPEDKRISGSVSATEVDPTADQTESTVDSGRRSFLSGVGALGAAAAMPLVIAPRWARAATWPDRSITAVVMYAAGGGTDVVLRALAGEMAKSVGWDINVINKPGGVGAVATSFVLGKPADGYWWLGAANYNKFVRIMGGSDSVAWTDWQFYQAANSLASWSVRTDSPFKSFEELVAFAKKNPGKLSISTSGTGGIWHELAAIVAQAAGIKIKYVPYKGGKPATLAGLQGETDIAGGGVHEHIEFIRAGKLRCLQQTGTKDINVEGVGVLPSIGNFLPELKPQLPVGGNYNIVLRRDTPLEILKEVEKVFVAAVKSPGFQEVAKKRYFDIDIRTGEAADRRAAQLEVLTAATFAEVKDQLGKKPKSAAELGLPSPADFDKWWPPKGYKPRMA